jgi:hypothetical protein
VCYVFANEMNVVIIVSEPDFRYNEIRFLEGPELFKPYTGSKTPAGIIGHFVQLVWASMYRVGCVRIWNPENTVDVYRWVLICNYKAGPGGTSANILDAHIFGEGEPCSNCLYNTLSGSSQPT